MRVNALMDALWRIAPPFLREKVSADYAAANPPYANRLPRPLSCFRARSIGGFLAHDHPGRAEAIVHHAEAIGEERLAHRHRHLAPLGKRLKDPLRLSWFPNGDLDAESLRRA